MKRIGWVVLAVGVVLSCVHPGSVVPLVRRPDTRLIGMVTLDTNVFRQTMEILQAAMPNEAGLCYTGELRDTTYLVDSTPAHGQWLILHGVTQAVADSTGLYNVWYSILSGCTGPILAVAHSHPYAFESQGDPCNHSGPDANVLFLDRRALVSFVWCRDGRLQILYQDGRRNEFRWRS